MSTEQSAENEWSEEEEQTARLLNEEFTKRLDVQREAGTSVDTKASIVGAAGLTAVQFIATQKRFNVPLLISAIVALGATIGLSYSSLRLRNVHEVPEPRHTYFTYQDMSPARVLFELALAKVEAFERNRRTYARKAMLHDWSLWALIAAAILAVAARILGR
jgi:hypothetical protein